MTDEVAEVGLREGQLRAILFELSAPEVTGPVYIRQAGYGLIAVRMAHKDQTWHTHLLDGDGQLVYIVS